MANLSTPSWRAFLFYSGIVGLMVAIVLAAFSGQWLAAFFAALLTLAIYQLHTLLLHIQRYTKLLATAMKGERDVHFSPIDASPIGQLGRALNLIAQKTRRIGNKRERERDRLMTILAHMSSGALLLNRHGRVRFINPAATEFLHVETEKVMRKSLPQVVWDYRITEVWMRCVDSGEEQTETLDLDGSRSVRVIVTPFLKGADRGYLVLLNDLSQVRRLEKVRRDFVSNVSHELRTPLASLRALTETLRDGALDDPPAAERFLGSIEIEVDKMTQMVEELLELSRIESGQVPLKLDAATTDRVIHPVVERLAMQAERANVTVNVELPLDLPLLLVDVERMNQVLINLIHNAIKFTPAKGTISITACKSGDDMVLISVKDTGVGIPLADVPRIFERFFKSDRARSGGGTGLGLAISKHIVQAHGGNIWVESEEGHGSTFYFTIPVNLVSATPYTGAG